MRFEIGDTVRISSSCDAEVGEPMYPRGRDGTIIRITGEIGDYPVKVRFQNVDYNGEFSVFREGELKLVRRN